MLQIPRPQTDPLNQADLAATHQTLELLQTPHLAFYNFGMHSGRSQPHKHVQILPLPLCGGASTKHAADGAAGGTPIDALVAAAAKGKQPGEVFTLPAYDFAHAVSLLPSGLPTVGTHWSSDSNGVGASDAGGSGSGSGGGEGGGEGGESSGGGGGDGGGGVAAMGTSIEATDRADAAGAALLAVFKAMLASAGLEYGSSADSDLSYNWLCTSKWMMVVGRAAEGFEGFNINSVVRLLRARCVRVRV